MAGASVTLTSLGARQIEASMAGLLSAFGDLTPLMETFGSILESDTVDRFDTETAPDGTKWQQSQRAKDDGGKTLTLSAQLRLSVHSIASASQVELGTNKVYAGAHQDGVDGTVTIPTHTRTIDEAFGRRLKAPVTFTVNSFERAMNMPQREFLGLSPTGELDLMDAADDYARDAWGAQP